MRLQAGDNAPTFTATDIDRNIQSLVGFMGYPLMLSFYRYAACPLSNLRISQLMSTQPQHGLLKMLAVFPSSKANIRRYVWRQHLSFPVIADPDMTLYALYGIEEATPLMMQQQMPYLETIYEEAARRGFLAGPVDGNLRQLPADFLINPDGTIHTAHYGRDLVDHIPAGTVAQFVDGVTTTHI